MSFYFAIQLLCGLGVEKFSPKCGKKIYGHKNGLVQQRERERERQKNREAERESESESEHRLRTFSKPLHNAQHEMASLCDDFQWANFKIHPSFSFNPCALIVQCYHSEDRNKQQKNVANESFAIYHRINWLQFNCIIADGTNAKPPSTQSKRTKKKKKEMKSNRIEGSLSWYVFIFLFSQNQPHSTLSE